MRSIIAVALLVLSAPVIADEYVSGYYRQDGTYVQPYYRSSPRVNYFPQLNFQPTVKLLTPFEIEQQYQQIEQLRLQNQLLQQQLQQ